ncbi:MAG: UxaA family hydrolase [Treponema sp.]|jgi:galactarate dehydratase|nr:UxaA family hydrolase [Treponema sp.]
MVRIIKIKPEDNAAIPVEDVKQGEVLAGGLTALCSIPQGHKIALADLKPGDKIIRYGVSLGGLKTGVKAGGLISEQMLELPEASCLDRMPWGTQNSSVPPLDPSLPVFFDGYEAPGAFYAGTRNILGIMTGVQCVTGVLNVAVRKIREELLPQYPNVDGVTALNHAYGCGVAIHARESVIPIRTLKNILRNPNFGGEIMAVGLGCEKLTMDMLLEPEENNTDNVIILQEQNGFHAMIKAVMAMAERKLDRLNRRRRQRLPLERLCIGFQCGGSDAFSGITANPSAGYASDLLVSAGATVLFSEVTEVRDGAYLLAARCADRETAQKLAAEMNWYDRYLEAGGVDRSANPSPGNKKGGLANIIEKAMGSIAKSGTAPIVEVLSPGERPSRKGLIFAATPASDFVCGPLQMASGISLQVFMTGRGTPYGLEAVPVIKVSSRTAMKDVWYDLIDINAGSIAEGTESIEDVGRRIYNMIVETASGRHKPWAEEYGIFNDLCIFDPGPLT